MKNLNRTNLLQIDGQPLPIPTGSPSVEYADIESDDSGLRIRFTSGGILSVSGIFVAYGVAGSAELARKVGALTEGNRILVDPTMATNIPGLYAAGDCTGGMLQVAKAVYEGALAGTAVVKAARGK